MTNQELLIDMKRFTRDQQGTGAFDGGRITEVKPIGFPHEPSGARRIGPLFYWAWATAKGFGKIGPEPASRMKCGGVLCQVDAEGLSLVLESIALR